ncbi:hypothetical protein CTM61_09945 [Prevotella intermedia]|nr:hypothetical protein [Prevotella intermedia]ATV55701.1 hypothetical protein CTM61_09945 [Prevotella intermedia]
MVFLWNYLYKTGVVLRRGKCRGCGVVSDGSTMVALPIVRHRQGWLGLLHRLDAVARSVRLASVDVQRRQESHCTEQDKMFSHIVIICFELACCAESVLQRAANGRQPSIVPLCKDRCFQRVWGIGEGEIWAWGRWGRGL